MEHLTRHLLTSAAALFVISCGDGADRPDDAPADSDTREARSADTRSGGARDALTVSDWEVFGAHESLPVDFEHPAGWSHRRTSTDRAWHGVFEPGDGQRIQVEYILSPGTPPDIARRMREGQMELLREAELGGDTVQVYGRSFPETATANAILTFPHDGEYYDLILTVRAPRECEQAAVEAIRQRAVDTLAPNDDTDFDREAFMAVFSRK